MFLQSYEKSIAKVSSKKYVHSDFVILDPPSTPLHVHMLLS